MIAKKSSKADLEKKRFAFFQIGLIVSGSLCLAAFEYASVEQEVQMTTTEFEGPLTLGPPETFHFQEQQEEKQKVVAVQQEVVDDVTIVKGPLKEGIVVKYSEKIEFDESDKEGYGTFTIIDEDDIVLVPDIEPEFIGGLEAMYTWIGKNVNYPALEAEMGIGGTAFVHFVVNTDGSICSVTETGIEQDLTEGLSKEAMRVVKSMPKWNPGEKAGKKVRVRYTIPIRFVAPR